MRISNRTTRDQRESDQRWLDFMEGVLLGLTMVAVAVGLFVVAGLLDAYLLREMVQAAEGAGG